MPKKKGYLKGVKARSSSQPDNVPFLLEKGYAALSRVEPEAALSHFEKALAMEPHNTNVMDAIAEVLLQVGEQEQALQLLIQSTTIAPTENPMKWFNLAQLQNGSDAHHCYASGIELLKADLSKLTDDSEDIASVELLNKQLAKALCSMAELYLTDLCYDDGAEQQCENLINEALTYDPNSLDAQNAQASLRISQSRIYEACDIIEKVFSVIKAQREAVAQITIVDDLQAGIDTSDVPIPELCIASAKILLECATARPQLAGCASELIVSLLEDDHDNVELWYLAGIAEMGNEADPSTCDLEEASYYFNQAKTMIDEMRDQYKQECDAEGVPVSERAVPFEEEYCLVQSHLQMIADKEAAEGIEGGGTGGRAAALVAAVAARVAEEEEWSDEEREDGNMES
jgi:tetratricopeptide (TPR) repeat protein